MGVKSSYKKRGVAHQRIAGCRVEVECSDIGRPRPQSLHDALLMYNHRYCNQIATLMHIKLNE